MRWIIVLVLYHTSWITSGPKSNFICDNIPTKAILSFFGCSEVNSTWLITSERANQRARKVWLIDIYYIKLSVSRSSVSQSVKQLIKQPISLFFLFKTEEESINSSFFQRVYIFASEPSGHYTIRPVLAAGPVAQLSCDTTFFLHDHHIAKWEHSDYK